MTLTQSTIFGPGGVSGGSGGGISNPIPDDQSLVFGTTAPSSFTALTTTTNDEFRMGVGGALPIFSITTEANKAFNYLNVVPGAVTDPTILMVSGNQARNEFVSFGYRASSRAFAFNGSGGNDIDGTAQNADGTTIRFEGGEGGDLGGDAGGIEFQTGRANFGDTDGGDVIYYFGQGNGTGRQGAIIAGNSNADLRFKLNGTGLFRFESSNDKNSALTIGYDTFAGTVLFGNTAAGERFKFTGTVEVTERFNQGYDNISVISNDLQMGDGNTGTCASNDTIEGFVIERWEPGAVVTIVFTGTPTIKHDTAGGAGTVPFKLKNGADFTPSKNPTTAQFLYDGTYALQIGDFMPLAA